LWSIKVSLIAYNIAHGGDGKLRRYWTWAGVLLVVVAIVIAPSVQAAGNVGFFTGLSRSSFGLDVDAGAIELSWAMYNWQEPSVRPGYIRPASVAQAVWRVAYAPWHIGPLSVGIGVAQYTDGRSAPKDVSPPGAPWPEIVTEQVYRRDVFSVTGIGTLTVGLEPWQGHVGIAIDSEGVSLRGAISYHFTDTVIIQAGWLQLPGEDWYSGPYAGLYARF